MKVIRGISRLKNHLRNSVIAIGTFDGVHRGHRQVIRTAALLAKKKRLKSAVVTFWPLPRMVLQKRNEGIITSLEEKEKIIERLGIDVLVVIKFTQKFAQLTPEAFVAEFICRRFRPARVVVGSDFHFGKDRAGTAFVLRKLGKKYGFDVSIVPEVSVKNSKVSATRIRRLLSRGKIREANELLGRCYSIEGKVIRGEGRGRTLLFPTANIKTSNYVVLPRGVYLCSIKVGSKNYKGLTNIGFRPTFSSRGKTGKETGKGSPIVEVHILGLRRNLYGQKVKMWLLEKIREEMKFPSPRELVKQLKKDVCSINRVALEPVT